MKRFLALALLFSVPLTSFAAGDAISRREGFLMMWQSIRRPAEPAKTVFNDVPEPAKGSLEIDYAASRGIIDDEDDNFHPDDALTFEDALIWLFRTRNIADPDEITPDTLSGFLATYPIAYFADASAVKKTISEEELLNVMRRLDATLVSEEHEVSLYAENFHGEGTAFGESFDMFAPTAAHRTFPHNTLVRVTNVSNGKSIVVRINDRGPYVKGRDMDLSLASFTAIENRSRGKFMATFQRLGDARLVNACTGESPEQQRVSRDVILENGVPHNLKLGSTLTLNGNKTFVMRGVTYPDGVKTQMQDFIFTDETFTFKPSIVGEYVFLIGSADGKTREMTMKVMKCDE